jgi:large subunit ribosomal protein L4
VSGGGAKPWRQKGSGNARQGTKRAPQWAGGGVVFGPVPRSYDFSLPKKVRTAALRSALSHRFVDGNIIVIDSLEVGEYKTKRIIEILQGLSLDGCRVLIAIDAPDEHLQRSTRNLPGVQVILVEGLNVFDVLRYEKLLVTKAAVAAIEVRLAGRSKESGS